MDRRRFLQRAAGTAGAWLSARYLAGDTAMTTTLQPGQSIATAMKAAVPGTTIQLRAGTYTESPDLRPNPGTAGARNTLMAYPGEKAVIKGLPVFTDPDYWTFRNLTFTQGAATRLHLVKVHGGTGWELDGVEVYGAAQTGLLVGRSSTYGAPQGWTIRNSTFHDCGYTPAYLNPGRDATGGLVERNLFYDAGTECCKLGWGGTGVANHLGEFGVGEVTFRYNTAVKGGTGPSLVIAEPSDAKLIDVHHNLFVDPGTKWAVRIDNEEGQLGTNVTVHDNAWWDTDSVVKFAYDFGKSPAVMAAMTANVKLDPKLDATYHPTTAQGYGRYAR